MSINLTNKDAQPVAYTRYRIEGIAAEYISAANSDIDKDKLTLTSRVTGASSNSYGNRRSTMKLVDTVAVAMPNSVATVAKDAKVEISVSLPVGVSPDVLEDLAHRLGTQMLDKDFMSKLCIAGQIDY